MVLLTLLGDASVDAATMLDDGCATVSPTEEFAVTLIRSLTPGHPGNSVAAIREADALGYDYVEIDVMIGSRLSRRLPRLEVHPLRR